MSETDIAELARGDNLELPSSCMLKLPKYFPE